MDKFSWAHILLKMFQNALLQAGPMEKGIHPAEASERVTLFQVQL